MKSRTFGLAAAAAALLVLTPFAAAAASTDEPLLMLRVDVSGKGSDIPHVKVSLPLSLIDVVIDSVDINSIAKDVKSKHEIDIRKLWREIRNAKVDEFVTVEKDNNKVKVYKEGETFRVSVQEPDYDSPNVEIRIPFSVMDYLTEEHEGGLKLSDMVAGLKSTLPLTIVEAHHDGENVKVWIEQK